MDIKQWKKTITTQGKEKSMQSINENLLIPFGVRKYSNSDKRY